LRNALFLEEAFTFGQYHYEWYVFIPFSKFLHFIPTAYYLPLTEGR